MRLSESHIQAIAKAAADCFGQEARLWLFGSRVDDRARGGDIDLLVEVDGLDADAAVQAKLNMLKQLRLALGDQKIDLVVRRSNSKIELPIYQQARSTGVRLQ